MNGIHDLGGMHGFGPVEREDHEPVFHAPWERTVLAMMRVGQANVFNLDEFRHAIERMDPAEYLASSYYERWLAAIERLYVEKGVITAEELAARTRYFREHPEASATDLVTPRPVARPSQPGDPRTLFRREGMAPPRFKPGDRVVTRTIHPRGHTRLPRYARGKRGVVERCHGVFVFPDTNAHGLGEQPQPVYSVRFDAAELWGESAEGRGAVNLDLWESYLLPA